MDAAQVCRNAGECVAPTALRNDFINALPALPRWAIFWRPSGAAFSDGQWDRRVG